MRRPHVPDALVAVLVGGLSAEPAGRPATPDDLAAALGAAAFGQPTATPLHPAAAESGGRQVGSRYELERQVGSGATGVVFAGRRRADGRPVAVKLLRGELAAD